MLENVTFDVSTSELNVRCNDSDKIRQKILNVSYAEWQKMGFSKGTLYYMKKNAAGNKPFTLNRHVRERLDQWPVNWIDRNKPDTDMAGEEESIIPLSKFIWGLWCIYENQTRRSRELYLLKIFTGELIPAQRWNLYYFSIVETTWQNFHQSKNSIEILHFLDFVVWPASLPSGWTFNFRYAIIHIAIPIFWIKTDTNHPTIRKFDTIILCPRVISSNVWHFTLGFEYIH